MSKNFDQNSFLFAANGDFVEDLYIKYLDNPNNVDDYWREFFAQLGDNELQALKATKGASWLPRKNKVIFPSEVVPAIKVQTVSTSISNKKLEAKLIITQYRANGHFLAKIDPLDLEKINYDINENLSSYGINEAEFDVEFDLNDASLGLTKCTLRQLVARLKEIYCSSVGYECNFIDSMEEKDWLYQQIEQLNTGLSNEEKIEALKDLIDVEGFEQFIHSRFPGSKRFSVEGGETSIIATREVIKTAAEINQVEEVVIGMAHRGRLNMLTKVMGKDYAAMLSEFQGNLAHVESLGIPGDVKYHIGKSSDYITKNGRKVHLSLTANPSHLEAVNPVVSGKVRAKQDGIKDIKREKVMGLLIHGDAAFCGQGVVMETLCLSDIPGYTTGGIMHIVINNQIGFTATPKDGRKGRYPTEFAKVIQAPIIHVNGDDVEMVIKVSRLAELYRHKFKKDVVIDVVCYRKYGHNEGDEPMFTQPIMYEAIKNKKSPAQMYMEELNSLKIMTQEQADSYKIEKMKFLDQKLAEAKTYKPIEEDWLKGQWFGMEKNDRVKEKESFTGISIEKLKEIGKALVTYPSDMLINSKVQRLLEQKNKMFETGESIDWGTAEALAFGSLLIEGSNIRLSGQDCKRGTFSSRHAVLCDQLNEKEYVPLNNIKATQANFEVINSVLSEYAVLGFEYGYSMVDPKDLTIWEAQYGDFANGAQIMIDQFVASSEVKWLRMSGLVMLLPHGYEGDGPEHSSARLERYLELCADDNMQVVNCTSPANFFHALRRQIHRKFRKPLIVMSPKSLLRHKMVVSNLEDMAQGSEFKSVIGEIDEIKKAKRVILCSGKVFFDLYEARQKAEIKDIALIRIEQYYPFPGDKLKLELEKYGDAEILWCQEEPKNMGAWSFLESKIELCLTNMGYKNYRPKYIVRPESASPSAGYKKMHTVEQEKLIKQAMTEV
jgi:2-oxoglutarate dehydrogenase E1 component